MVGVSASGGAAVRRKVCMLCKQGGHLQLHPQRVVLPDPAQQVRAVNTVSIRI